jgi:hypothetical protein
MARLKSTMTGRPIESYEHTGEKRLNNPPVGLVTPDTDPDAGAKRTYAYDPHLDPKLQWAGKAEHTSFEVTTVSLHVHERINPRTIVEAVRKRNGRQPQQMSLFAMPEENPPLRQAIQFYIGAYRGTISLPFAAGEHRRIAVRIVDDRGIESLKVLGLEG